VLANDQWGISASVIWELSKLAQLGRIDLDIDSADFAAASAEAREPSGGFQPLPEPAGFGRKSSIGARA
jgi:hypothetical protein